MSNQVAMTKVKSMVRSLIAQLLILPLFLVGLASCSEPTFPLEIRFQAMVGEQAFSCQSTYENQGSANTEISFTDFRFYLHNIRLVTDEGEEIPLTLDDDNTWQQEHLALLDFEDGTGTCRNGSEQMHTTLVGHAPDRTFNELRFTIGVPFEDNHINPATADPPLTFTNMSWGWQGGYKFLRADVSSSEYNFIFHLGSTGCEGTIGDISGCSRLNRAEVTLTNFNPATDTIIVDAALLFESTNVSQNTQDSLSGCMSTQNDPDCAALFGNMGLNLETGHAESTASFFRVQE